MLYWQWHLTWKQRSPPMGFPSNMIPLACIESTLKLKWRLMAGNLIAARVRTCSAVWLLFRKALSGCAYKARQPWVTTWRYPWQPSRQDEFKAWASRHLDKVQTDTSQEPQGGTILYCCCGYMSLPLLRAGSRSRLMYPHSLFAKLRSPVVVHGTSRYVGGNVQEVCRTTVISI